MSWLCQGGMEQRSIPLIYEYFITLKCKMVQRKVHRWSVDKNNKKVLFSLYPNCPGM